MPVCSYLVIPEPGAVDRLAGALTSLPGCDVMTTENRDLLLLVTDTPDAAADRELRDTIEGHSDLQALILSFGQIDPDTEQRDPVREGRPSKKQHRRRLPVVDTPGAAGTDQ